MNNTKILVVEDDQALAASFRRILRDAGYGAEVAQGYAAAREQLMGGTYSAVVMDINLQDRHSGIDLLREIREINLDTPVVIITGFPEVASAAEAVRYAAFDYLCKPVEREQLLKIAGAAVRHKLARDQKDHYYEKLEEAFRHLRTTLATVNADLSRPEAPQDEDATPVVGATDPSTFPGPRSRPVTQEALLSEREEQVLALLGHGESSAEIAAAFFSSLSHRPDFLTNVNPRE